MITDLNWFAKVLNLLAVADEIKAEGLNKKSMKQLSKCFVEKLLIWPKDILKQKLTSLITADKVNFLVFIFTASKLLVNYIFLYF